MQTSVYRNVGIVTLFKGRHGPMHLSKKAERCECVYKCGWLGDGLQCNYRRLPMLSRHAYSQLFINCNDWRTNRDRSTCLSTLTTIRYFVDLDRRYFISPMYEETLSKLPESIKKNSEAVVSHKKH